MNVADMKDELRGVEITTVDVSIKFKHHTKIMKNFDGWFLSMQTDGVMSEVPTTDMQIEEPEHIAVQPNEDKNVGAKSGLNDSEIEQKHESLGVDGDDNKSLSDVSISDDSTD